MVHGRPDGAALRLLECGEVEIEGRLPWSSNATFLTTVRSGDAECRAVYKPGRGERPLWDFPSGLYRREVAAYRLSEALGWGLVPPTLIREGPLGEGSFQLFIEADFEQHYFTLHEDPAHRARLEAVVLHQRVRAATCLFDATKRPGAASAGDLR
jgi:uncharacterized repeat protein (TIGR03843 family)